MLHIIKNFRFFNLKEDSKSFFDNNPTGNFLLNNVRAESVCAWYEAEIKAREYQISLLEEKHKLCHHCSKGCSDCCKQAIIVSPLEHDILKVYLHSLDRNAKEELLSRCKAILRTLRDLNIPDTYNYDKDFITKQSQINAEYFALQLPCPMLNSENECMCYPVRPVPCWTYRNYGSILDCKKMFAPPYCFPYEKCGALVEEYIYKLYLPQEKSNLMLLPKAIYFILKKQV